MANASAFFIGIAISSMSFTLWGCYKLYKAIEETERRLREREEESADE
ncbi:MAG: hypothetical protein ACKOX6_12130 [Bdellovibrio sp.]